MVCTVVTLPDGVTAIVCGPKARRRYCACGKVAPLLCDWKVPTKRSGTCDRPICTKCTFVPAPDKDLCPAHAQAWVIWKTEKGSA